MANEAKAPKDDKNKFWDTQRVEIEHAGSRITLPAEPRSMPTEAAIAALTRLLAEEREPVRVFEIIDAYPLDAAVAFLRALQNKYGWASPVPTPGFFGPEPPRMVTV